MSQTTNVEQVKLNIMTQEQFNSTTPSPNEFYMIVDADNITKEEVIAALGYTPYDSTNPAGYISVITSSDITTALGYTPYDSTNPSGYISGITSSDVTTALGYTPYDSTNPAGYISGITSSDITTALGFTPYDATNPEGYISGITSSDVTAALGYTPYDATNPSGYISSAAISSLTDVSLTNVTNNQALLYNVTTQKWENKNIVTSTAWGGITGTLADQTDLQQALDGKQPTVTGAATTITNNDLTAGRVLISDNSGKVATSSITTAKLGYLSDVTSNIQVQLNDKTTMSEVEAKGYLTSADLQGYQPLLVSGTNIKTINNQSILGNGNIEIQEGGEVDQTYDATSANAQSGTAVAGALSGYVTTNTDQNITGTKTFIGTKKVAFKQSGANDKLGFTLYTNSGVEKGYLEFNPTNTIDGAPLMTLGNFASSASAITQIGFRRYSSVSGASGAYNLLTPLIADAKTPFSLTTTYTNFYLPLGFTDGTTTVKTEKSGVVDLSSILPDISGKQDTLVSGINIKTINDQSLLGSGDITISGGAVDSVNGYTGVVVLTASDVGALAATDVTEYTATEVETLWGSI